MLTFTYEFLKAKLGDQVDVNPVTGQPCLAFEHNIVWQAIDQNCGIESTAEVYGLPIEEVGKWIDEHYVPQLYAHDLAYDICLSEHDVQVPLQGYQDPETGACWPCTWSAGLAELRFEKVIQAVRGG